MLQSQGLQVIGLTSKYGFIAAVAAWSVLPGAALPAHDAVVLGAEGLLGQRLVTLGTAETLLMPVPALMAELLMEEEREGFLQSFVERKMENLWATLAS